MNGGATAFGGVGRRARDFALLILAAVGFLSLIFLGGRALAWGARSVVVAEALSPGGDAVAYLVETEDGGSSPVQSVRIGFVGTGLGEAAVVYELRAATSRMSESFRVLPSMTSGGLIVRGCLAARAPQASLLAVTRRAILLERPV